MMMASPPRRFLASSLSLLLLSCSTARHSVSGPTGALELGRYVLIIERAPDGQVSHSWKPVEEFNPAAHASLALPHESQRYIVQTTFNRNCEEERDACESMCMASLKGRNWSHMSAGSKSEHCRRVCMQPYLDCNRLKELAEGRAVKFHAIDQAVDWMKRNSEKLLAGAVIVIAGVAFVVVVGASGGGVLLLAPVVVLASSNASAGPRSLAVGP